MKPISRNVTLADVARSAGVAPMTVSRFLNKHPNISDKTAKKVSAAIKRLGYTPNLAARMLAGQSAHAIGVVVPNLADPFYAELAQHLQAEARARGVLVWIGASDADPAIEAALISRMNQQGIDGIIVVLSPGESQFCPEDLRMPVVVMDRPLRKGVADTVLVENRRSARDGVEHLLGHGYRSIYCLSTYTANDFTNTERIAGYSDAMQAASLKNEVISDLRTPELMVATLRRILESRSDRPALFTTHNLATVHVMSVLHDLRIKVPAQMPLLGFDDLPMAAMIRPSPTVIRQPIAALAQQAAKLLFGHIAGKQTEPVSAVTLSLATSLILRESCGCPGVSVL